MENTPMDREYMRKVVEERGEKIVGRLVDGVDVLNASRLDGLGEKDKVLYCGNHQTLADMFIPHGVILKNGWPAPRSVAKSGLVNPVFGLFIEFMSGVDIKKSGLLVIDSKNRGRDYLAEYSQRVGETFSNGESLLVFPEGHRYNNSDGMPDKFKR